MMSLLAVALLAHPFHIPPYLQAVDQSGATVLWAGPPGVVEVVAPDGGKQTVKAEAREGMVRARVEGLAAGTPHRFTVRAGDNSVEGRFTTAPRPGHPFTFTVYGDNRDDHAAHAAVVAAVRLSAPDLLISTGDLVGYGGEMDQWLRFFDIEKELLRETVLFPVLGNHEVAEDEDAAQFRRFFELPGNELYYSFTWGNVRFVAIDGEINVDEHGPDGPQRAWLLKELAAAKADPSIDHVVGFVHKGPFSSNPYREGNPGLREALPELQKAGLTLLLCGHDHFYERGTSAGGLPYFVLGSGGAPLYPTNGPGKHRTYTAEVSRSVHAYARFRVHGKHLSACGVDISGVAFDCVDLGPKKRPAP